MENNSGFERVISKYVLGIDLGTTNSSVAVYGPQGMDVVNIPEEGLSMPSVVRFPDRSRDDLQVGTLAKKWIVSKPDEVFSSFKTQMASSEWALDPQVKAKYTIDGEELDPTFMATQVLIKIRDAVQNHPVYGTAGTICKAVICVPAQCQPTYIENVFKAAKLAGDINSANADSATNQNGPSFSFTQNNYSPKALSQIDIYRQTKNQFSAMKGVLSKA